MAGHAARDRIPWRPLGQEPRAERLAQGALPVGIGFRVRRRVLMNGGDWGDDVRLDRVNRNRANGRDVTLPDGRKLFAASSLETGTTNN